MNGARACRGLATVAGWLAVVVLLPAPAGAAVLGRVVPSFPATMTVGQSGLPASLTLENRNTTALHDTLTNSVCNVGDPLNCPPGDRGIVLVPSCAAYASGRCTAAGADPGVFRLSATGTGRAGTACAGKVFSIAGIDPAFGAVRFTPQPAGSHVELPGFEARCVIDFTVSVLKAPAGDVDIAAAGVQTGQASEHHQYAGLPGPGAPHSHVLATTSGATVVTPPPPPPTPVPDFAVFTNSPTSLRVSKTGRFAYRFLATPKRTGKAKLTSTKPVRVFTKKRKLRVATKSFKAPANATVKLKFKLSSTTLKALKRRTSVKFKVDVTVGATKFFTYVRLKPPKR